MRASIFSAVIRIDNVGLSEIWADIVKLTKGHAGHSSDSAAETKCQRVNPSRSDAHRTSHAAVLSHSTHAKTESGVAKHSQQDYQYRDTEQDYVDTVIWEYYPASEIDRAHHPARASNLTIGGAKDGANKLLQN